MAAHRKSDQRRVYLCAGGFRKGAAAYYFSMDTSVALIIAKTLSPSLRFIRLTEPVVIIDVTSPAAVLMVSSETTLSETILSIVPGSRFRMLVLIIRDSITQPRATSSGQDCELATPERIRNRRHSINAICAILSLLRGEQKGDNHAA